MSSTLLTFADEYDTMPLSITKGQAMSAEPKELNHRFANFIDKRMKERGLEPVDLTSKFGIPQATVSRWREGDLGKNPDLKNFVAFSEALDRPLWEVLEHAGYKIDRPSDPDAAERELARQIESTAELRPIVDWLFDLDLDDRLAVMTFVEVLQRRRAEQGGKSNRPKGRPRKVNQAET